MLAGDPGAASCGFPEEEEEVAKPYQASMCRDGQLVVPPRILDWNL